MFFGAVSWRHTSCFRPRGPVLQHTARWHTARGSHRKPQPSMNTPLTPEERASGCVLPCVAYPESDVVLETPAI